MTVRIELTTKEVEFVRDVLEWWAEGYVEAEDITVESASTFEELLDITSGYSDQLQMVKDIRGKLVSDNVSSG